MVEKLSGFSNTQNPNHVSKCNNKSLAYKAILYLIINLLFLYKYGLRQNIINVYLLMLIYALSITIFGFILLSAKVQF